MTAVPPAQPAEWYRKDRPCAHCKARVESVVVKGDSTWLRVSHEETCKSEADRAIELRGSRRGDGNRGRAAVPPKRANDRPHKTRTGTRPLASAPEDDEE